MLIKDLLTRWRIKVDHEDLEHTSEKLEQIKNRIEIIGAAELLKSIYEMAEKFGEFAEQLLTTAESAGIGVEALQRLQYAAAQSGVGADDVSTAMARLSRSLYEAQSGSKEALKLFADIGIDSEQVAGIHDASQAFNVLSDRVSHVEDPIKRQAILMSLLGRGSFRMAAMMAKGSEALTELGEKGEQSGTVISETTLEALGGMQKGLITLGMVIKNITATIASYFSPAIKLIVQDFIQLWGANQEVLKADWHGWARTLGYILGFIDGLVVGLIRRMQLFADEHPMLTRLASGLALGITSLGIAGAFLVKVLEIAGWFAKLLAQGLGLLADLGLSPFKLLLWGAEQLQGLIAKLLLQFAVMVSEAFPALAEGALAWGAALESTPLGWFATAVAAIVLVVESLYTVFYKGGKFEDTWLGKIWKGLKSVGTGIADFLGISHEDENGNLEPGAKAANVEQNIPDLLRRSSGAAVENIAALHRDSPESQSLRRGIAGGTGDIQMGDVGPTNISAPMTFNINAEGQDAPSIAKRVGDHVQDRLGTVARNIKRAHATLEHA